MEVILLCILTHCISRDSLTLLHECYFLKIYPFFFWMVTEHLSWNRDFFKTPRHCFDILNLIGISNIENHSVIGKLEIVHWNLMPTPIKSYSIALDFSNFLPWAPTMERWQGIPLSTPFGLEVGSIILEIHLPRLGISPIPHILIETLHHSPYHIQWRT